MMDNQFEAKLIECFDALDQGKPIQQILDSYPADANRLRPLLETAAQLSSFSLQPSLAAQAKSRSAFLEQAATLKDARHSRPAFFFGLRKVLIPMMAVIVVLLFGSGLLLASASAVPGDTLYGAKQVIEGFQLDLAADSEAKSRLAEQFNQERIREIQALLKAGGDAEVTFSGLIERIQPEFWQIAGIEVQLSSESEIDGPAAVGASALVKGRVFAGKLTAQTITISADTSDSLTVTPIPTTMSTPSPRRNSSNDATIEPTATPAKSTLTPTAAVPMATTPDTDDGTSIDDSNDSPDGIEPVSTPDDEPDDEADEPPTDEPDDEPDDEHDDEPDDEPDDEADDPPDDEPDGD